MENPHAPNNITDVNLQIKLDLSKREKPNNFDRFADSFSLIQIIPEIESDLAKYGLNEIQTKMNLIPNSMEKFSYLTTLLKELNLISKTLQETKKSFETSFIDSEKDCKNRKNDYEKKQYSLKKHILETELTIELTKKKYFIGNK